LIPALKHRREKKKGERKEKKKRMSSSCRGYLIEKRRGAPWTESGVDFKFYCRCPAIDGRKKRKEGKRGSNRLCFISRTVKKNRTRISLSFGFTGRGKKRERGEGKVILHPFVTLDSEENERSAASPLTSSERRSGLNLRLNPRRRGGRTRHEFYDFIGRGRKRKAICCSF